MIEDLIESLEKAFLAKEIPFDTYLKIQWNIALHYRESGQYNEAVAVINNALETIQYKHGTCFVRRSL